jgi:hypothetical protein
MKGTAMSTSRETASSTVAPLPPLKAAHAPHTGVRGIRPLQIPIVDENRRLIGWTGAAPRVENGTIRHLAAERMVGGPIVGAHVHLVDPDDAARAGAPRGWTAPWRCIALVSARAIDPAGDGRAFEIRGAGD